MALQKRKSLKCPICVALTQPRVDVVDMALAPLLEVIRTTGEIPSEKDHRIQDISHRMLISPHSIHYHLKECLFDRDISDQRVIEIKDLAQAIAIAKSEYASNPSVHNATAYQGFIKTYNDMADAIQGSQDPTAVLEFVIETVLSPLLRNVLVQVTQELGNLKEDLHKTVAKEYHNQVDQQLNTTLSAVGVALQQTSDQGIDSLCDYFEVELDVQRRRRSVEALGVEKDKVT